MTSETLKILVGKSFAVWIVYQDKADAESQAWWKEYLGYLCKHRLVPFFSPFYWNREESVTIEGKSAMISLLVPC